MRRKTLYGIIGAILLAAVFFVCAVGSSWFTNGDIKTWFNGWGQNKPAEDEDKGGDKNNGGDNFDTETSGGELVVSCVEDCGISLLSAKIPRAAYAVEGISPQAITAYTLTASISPSNAADKSVDWTVEGDEADAITVTPASDGALTATVTCNKKFTGTLYIVCTSRNSGVFARCAVVFKGIPATLNISTSIPENGGYYAVVSKGTFAVDLSLDNEWHEVGSGYGDYEMTVTKHGSFEVAKVDILAGTVDTSSTKTVTLDGFTVIGAYPELIDFSLSGSVVNVTVNFHLSAALDGDFYKYQREVEKCYYAVTVREKKSGVSTSFKVSWGDSFVTDVNLSESEIVF